MTSLENQPLFTRRLCQSLDAAVILIPATIEDDGSHSPLDGATSDERAHQPGNLSLDAAVGLAPDILVQAGCRGQCLT